MAWPHVFAALSTSPMSYLDDNFNAAVQSGQAASLGSTAITGTLTVTEGASDSTISFTPGAGGAALVLSKIGSNVANALVVNMQVTNDLFCTFQVGGVQKGSVQWTGSAVAYNTTSDAAQKTLFGPADGSVLAAIPVHDASFTADPSARYPMVTAQELAAVAPWAVTVGDGTPENPCLVDHSALVPLVIAALQDALGRIAVLEAKAAISTLPTAALNAVVAAVAAVTASPVVQAAIARGKGGSSAPP